MSGIAGIFNLDGQPVDVNDLQAMLTTLKLRGPDGSDVWCEDQVGLGHTMLWNSPESKHEQLPMINTRGDLFLTADARIDNRDTLIDQLGFGEQKTSQIGDSQLILAAYDKWGEECPAKLLGDFSFAIWDLRRQVLFCTRDHFGAKPFCYYHRPGRVFIFASQVKSLLALPQVPRQVNEGRIADYLVGIMLEGIDNTSTFHQEIHRHPPSHTLSIKSDSISSRRYWSLDPTKEIFYKSEGEYAEAFLEVFSKAVDCRLRSPSPMGIMMSGGMDSTSIVGIARHYMADMGADPLHTYSAVSSDGDDPETRNIQAMLRMDGLQGTTVSPEQMSSFAADIDAVLEKSDDLFDNHIYTVPLILFIAAHRQGCRIMLTGILGDNVVSKSSSYITFLLRERKWTDWYLEVIGNSRTYYPYYSAWRALYRSARAELVPDWGRRIWRRIHPINSTRKINPDSIINRDFAQRIQLADRFERQRRSVNACPPKTLSELQANNLNAPYTTAGMERYSRVGGLVSIEARHPFMDVRLVEFCLALPWMSSYYRGRSKVVMRDAMDGRLPEQVLSTTYCRHLAPHFHRAWFLLKQPSIEKMLHDHLNSISEFADQDSIWQSYRRCSLEWTVEDWTRVRTAITLALWYQHA